MGIQFRVRVPATSANLGPGFDVMGVALSMYNEMALEVSDHLSVRISGLSGEGLPRDRTNAVVRAIDTVIETAGATRVPREFTLWLHNGIPVGSGLGSSASAIVGGLLLGNGLVNHFEPDKALSTEEILHLAIDIEGHPDNVAPALMGGLCLAVPGDDGFRILKVPCPENLHLVIGIPQFPLLTADSRKVLPDSVARSDAVFNIAQAARLILALTTKDLQLLRGGFGDKLHEPYRMSLLPGYPEIRTKAEHAGALTTTLSGAGPSVLIWCDDVSVALKVADMSVAVWTSMGIESKAEVLQVSMLDTAVEVVQLS